MFGLNYLLASASELCSDLQPILKLVGIIVWGIKVIVPILLIVIGMLDLAKAVTEKSDDKIKEAQNKLIKRAITAVLVFLVVSLVGILMELIGATDYKDCMKCINKPFSCRSISDINSSGR